LITFKRDEVHKEEETDEDHHAEDRHDLLVVHEIMPDQNVNSLHTLNPEPRTLEPGP
jgi:hypothetical protein